MATTQDSSTLSTTSQPTSTTAGTSSTTGATETTADGQGRAFLDDPYNMAMYVVLPTMVFVYGGCCFIYCMAKLRRYCHRRARRRARSQLLEKKTGGRRQRDDSDDDNGNDNAAFKGGESLDVSVVDLTEPQPEPPPQPLPKAKPHRQPPAVPPKPFMDVPVRKKANHGNRISTKTAATVVQASNSRFMCRGVQAGFAETPPGYQRDLHRQMQHLDDQLKAAFKLITDEPKGPKSRPDVCAKSNENKKPLKRRADSKMRFFASDQ